MRFDVITLFPEIISQTFSFGVTGRALERGLIELYTWNPRDYTSSPSRRVDAKPYSGGPGMVMQVDPLMRAIEAAKCDSSQPTHVVYMSAQGSPLNQTKIRELLALPKIILLSGRYEGIDQRTINNGVDEEISIGDFIVSGGELPSLIVIDSITRLIPGVLGDGDSKRVESFEDGLLEYPQYTRPENSDYGKVPKVLLSGDPKAIERWKLKQSLSKTLKNRPDLISIKELSTFEKELLNEIKDEETN